MTPADPALNRLQQLNAIGVALSKERNIDALLENILVAAKSITHADGGTLYRVSDDGHELRFEIVRTDSLNIALGGSTGAPINFPPLALYDDQGQPNGSLVAAFAVHNEATVNIEDAYAAQGFDFSGTRRFDAKTGYRSKSFLTVPMKDHEGVIIGVLQLINCLDPDTGEVITFSADDQQLAESLASQAAIALTNRMLVLQLEDLFESFINLINSAIDEKSPYTGGHCQRVPTLTMMLADAVAQAGEGPLSGFAMSEKDRYELRIASLLHDCGKITTPVHVVDKATKLETIFDRIHLIDTRFEVLKRDAQIDALKRIIELRAGGALDAETEAAVWRTQEAACRAMDEERDFLRRMNIGSEAMKEEQQQRVREIGSARQWRNAEGVPADLLTPNEIENLTIRAGTLTQQEREVINYHIVATIKMLEALPWPRHLKNVPEYAGGHHERMDGKGYPRGLMREQMSPQARMMGIADIFEALTACDRPYKVGMTVKQALGILQKFRENGHIDPDLHDIFLQSKVYKGYAQMFLNPEQDDAD